MSLTEIVYIMRDYQIRFCTFDEDLIDFLRSRYRPTGGRNLCGDFPFPVLLSNQGFERKEVYLGDFCIKMAEYVPVCRKETLCIKEFVEDEMFITDWYVFSGICEGVLRKFERLSEKL